MFNEKEIEEFLLKEFENIRTELIEEYERRGMEASGEFKEELRTEFEAYSKKYSVTLWGAKYAEQLQYGRKPSAKMPPLQAIYDWIIAKRIMDGTYKEYQIRGLAYVIAQKIKREGWNRRNHGGVGLISSVINAQRFKDIIERLGAGMLPYFETTLITMIKQNANDSI